MAAKPGPSSSARNTDGRSSSPNVRFVTSVTAAEKSEQSLASFPSAPSSSSSTPHQALDAIRPNRVSSVPQPRRYQQPRRKNPRLESSTQTESFGYSSPIKRKKKILAIPSSIPDSPPEFVSEAPKKSLVFQSHEQLASSPETSLLTEPLQHRDLSPGKKFFLEQNQQELQNSVDRDSVSLVSPNYLSRTSIPPNPELYQQDPVAAKKSLNSEEYQQLHRSDSWKSSSPDSQPYHEELPAFRKSVSPDSQAYQQQEEPYYNYAVRNSNYLDPQQYREDLHNSAGSPDSQLYEHGLQDSAFRKSFSPDSQPFQQDSAFRTSISPISRRNMYANHQQMPVSGEINISPEFQQQLSAPRMSASRRRMEAQILPPHDADSVPPELEEHVFPSSRISISAQQVQMQMQQESIAYPFSSSTATRTMSISPRQTESHQSTPTLTLMSPSRKSLHPQLQQHQQQQSFPRKSVAERESLFNSRQYQQNFTDSIARGNTFPDSRQSMYNNNNNYATSQTPAAQMNFSPREIQARDLPVETDDLSSQMEDDMFLSPPTGISLEQQEPVVPLQAQLPSSVSVAQRKSMSPRQTQIQQPPASSLLPARMKSISPRQTQVQRSSLLPLQMQISSPRKSSQLQLQQQFSPRKSRAEASQLDFPQYEQQVSSSAVGNNSSPNRALSVNPDLNQMPTEQMSISSGTQQQLSVSPRMSISSGSTEAQQLRAEMNMSPEMQQNPYTSPRMSISPRQWQSQQSPVELQVPTQELFAPPSQMASSPGERQTQQAPQLERMQSSMKRSLTSSHRQSDAQQASSPQRMQSRVQKSVSIPPGQIQNLHASSLGTTNSTTNKQMNISPEQMTNSPGTGIDKSMSDSPSQTVTEQVTSLNQIQNQQVISPQKIQSKVNKSMSVASRQEPTEQSTSPQRTQSTVDIPGITSPRKTQIQQMMSPGETEASIHRAMSLSPRQMQVQQQRDSLSQVQSSIQRSMSLSPRLMQGQEQQDSISRAQSSMQRSASISPTQINMEQQQIAQSSSLSSIPATLQGPQSSSPPQLNQYLSVTVPRVTVISSSNTNGSKIPQTRPGAKQMQYVRNNTRATFSASPSRRTHVAVDYHLAVTDVVLRSMAAIASAAAFCVMVTNTVLINGENVSYSMIAGFRYVAGSSATAFLIAILQLGAMVTRRLKSQDIALEAKPSIPWLAFTMIVDQMLAYFLLSAGSVGVAALVYIPSICKSVAISYADYCSRSTVSVVLTLVSSIVFVMSAMLSSFKFFQKAVGST